jgi:hypothetical protein
VAAALARQTAADFPELPVRAAAAVAAVKVAAVGPGARAARVARNWLREPFKAPAAVAVVAARTR